MQVSPPKQGSARRDKPALSRAFFRSAWTTIPASECIVVAAIHVSPPKQPASANPSFFNSPTFIGLGNLSHITTSSDFFFCEVFLARALPFFLLDIGFLLFPKEARDKLPSRTNRVD